MRRNGPRHCERSEAIQRSRQLLVHVVTSGPPASRPLYLSMRFSAERCDRVGRDPSPTVLVDGVDVMRPESGVRSGDACRLDLPTAQRILDALSKEAI